MKNDMIWRRFISFFECRSFPFQVTNRVNKQPLSGMVMTSALMIWKALMCITGSEAPIVVVLFGSMEPGFKRGDILFMRMSKDPIRVGDILSFNVNGHDISIVHRAVKGAILYHGNLVASVAGGSVETKFYPSDVYISYLPLAHIYERTNQIILAYYGGSSGLYQGVGTQTETELHEKTLRMKVALNATKAAVEEGVVVGGGCAIFRLSAKVHSTKDTLDNDEQKVRVNLRVWVRKM